MTRTVDSDSIRITAVVREAAALLGLIVLCTALAYGWSYSQSERQAQRDLSLNFNLKKTTVENEISSSLHDLMALVRMPSMRKAAADLDAAWRKVGENRTAVIGEWYGTNDIPRTASHSSADYFQLVADQEAWVRDFMQLFELRDVLLISADGDIIYSYRRGSDYATNLRTGPFVDSNLSNIYLRALRNRGRAVLSEMEFYEPEDKRPTFFSAASMSDDQGQPFAVLALRYKSTFLNKLLQRTESMGYTGDIFVIDIMQTMLSQSRLIADLTALKVSVDSEAATLASYGFSGMKRSVDHRGVQTLSAYAPINISGPSWGLVGHMDLQEVAKNAAHPTVLLHGTVGGALSWLMSLLIRFILTSRRQARAVTSS